jgi:SAM-dependent methyltransferase
MRAGASLPPAYFEDMFAGDSDPWRFETSPYERAKYADTIAALGDRRYRAAFEIGCANGVLTRMLMARCDSLVAIDVSPTAIAKARARCGEGGDVRFAEMAFPRQRPSPDPVFDLVVLSEVAYYWDDADLRLAAETVSELLAAGGDLLLVHWTGETDYPQSGDDAVDGLHAGLTVAVEVLRRERRPRYRLDLWRRAP